MKLPHSPNREYLDNFLEWYTNTINENPTFHKDGFIVIIYDNVTLTRDVIVSNKFNNLEIYREINPKTFTPWKTN